MRKKRKVIPLAYFVEYFALKPNYLRDSLVLQTHRNQA